MEHRRVGRYAKLVSSGLCARNGGVSNRERATAAAHRVRLDPSYRRSFGLSNPHQRDRAHRHRN